MPHHEIPLYLYNLWALVSALCVVALGSVAYALFDTKDKLALTLSLLCIGAGIEALASTIGLYIVSPADMPDSNTYIISRVAGRAVEFALASPAIIYIFLRRRRGE